MHFENNSTICSKPSRNGQTGIRDIDKACLNPKGKPSIPHIGTADWHKIMQTLEGLKGLTVEDAQSILDEMEHKNTPVD
jgi:hypothetical protein